MIPPRPLALLALVALAAGACAAAGPPVPEAPAPASEARDTMGFEVNLVRGQRCEEAFDLALYQDRGIELIEWAPGSGCTARTLTVRYLPGRTSPDTILRAVEKTGAKVTRSTQIKAAPR